MPENVRKSSRFSAVRASRGYNGAALVVQRRPRELAVRAPLQPREALTARPLRSDGKTAERVVGVNG